MTLVITQFSTLSLSIFSLHTTHYNKRIFEISQTYWHILPRCKRNEFSYWRFIVCKFWFYYASIPTRGFSYNIYWRPSHSLYKILRSLYENDYAQFPCIPCSYCSRMVYPHSAKWIVRDEPLAILFNYLFQKYHSLHVQLTHIKNCGMQYLQI